MLQLAGLAGGELSALDALRDTVLLVFFALVDVVQRAVRSGGERRGRCNDDGGAKKCMGQFHGGVLSFPLLLV